MKLQTKIPLQKQKNHLIDYSSQTLWLGSCFSENISAKFEYYKLQNKVNPFGILFHPLAIENLVSRALNNEVYTENELHFSNEQWCCLDAHSSFNTTEKETLLSNLNQQLEITYAYLKTATHIVITLGTSWVYKHKATNTVVANCHKLPQHQFKKELLTVNAIEQSLKNTVALIKSHNTMATVVFTISPVRHIKDGLVENTQSKAHLLTAIHKLLTSEDSVLNPSFYFPSYEIMMDELRDYRFYKLDMLHPSSVAIDYIWEAFKTVWLSQDAFRTMQHVERIQKQKAHKPFNTNSEAHQKSLLQLQLDIDALTKNYPHMVFD